EAIKALKDLTDAIGSPHRDCRQDGAKIGHGVREAYLFNSGIAGIERADRILLVGANPRVEAPIINARIRKAWLANLDLKIGVVGEAYNLTYDYEHLGVGPENIAAAEAFLSGASRPLIIVGMGALARDDGAAILAETARIGAAAHVVTDDWNGFNILHTAAARVAALDLGFLPGDGGRDFAGIIDGAQHGEIEVVYNLGCDEFDASRLANAFVIYQGHHGDAGAKYADVIFPAASCVEQNGIYVNTEGRAQFAHRAHFPFGEAREDWAIIRAFSDYIGKTLPYDDIFSLRQAAITDAPSLARIGEGPTSETVFDLRSVGAPGAMNPAPFSSCIKDYYLTNAIARASRTMAECSAVASGAARIAAE
ncbi:MAG: molybdopterin-dependent oxidoreductase, partial [Parvularculaceae bacterium]|nr:molybdopterin-dependent oxidoreductase [Parvularculaceae bacterium]